jgi:hypothetical protein
MVTRHDPQRVIIISGVRYNVIFRLDTHWTFKDEWYAPEGNVASPSNNARKRIGEVNKARYKTEPWLHAEIAHGEHPEKPLVESACND